MITGAEGVPPWAGVWAELQELTGHLSQVVRSAQRLHPSESAYFRREVGQTYDLLVSLAWTPIALLAPQSVPSGLQPTVLGELPLLRRAMARHALDTDEVTASILLGEREAALWSAKP